MHAKYEVSISYGSKVMAKVKVFLPQSHRQTGQKVCTPEFYSGGIKNQNQPPDDFFPHSYNFSIGKTR